MTQTEICPRKFSGSCGECIAFHPSLHRCTDLLSPISMIPLDGSLSAEVAVELFSQELADTYEQAVTGI